jgi:hypothetical protein
MKPLVIYHGNCQDGFTAAWACWLKHPDWEYYPAKHGDPPPDVTGKVVYMLDFSYKRPVILELLSKATCITILDHHQSAKKNLQFIGEVLSDVELQKLTIIFDMSQSGAMLAWKYFHSGATPPQLVEYVQDRDLWKFKYPGTKAFSAVLFSEEYDFLLWSAYNSQLESGYTMQLLEQGEAINRKHNKDIAELLTNKFQLDIGGFTVWVANLPYTMASDAAGKLAEGMPFGATYYYDGEGYVFSLRSQESGIDVSEIASKYGGGGHKHAAGFKIKSSFGIEL